MNLLVLDETEKSSDAPGSNEIGAWHAQTSINIHLLT